MSASELEEFKKWGSLATVVAFEPEHICESFESCQQIRVDLTVSASWLTCSRTFMPKQATKASSTDTQARNSPSFPDLGNSMFSLDRISKPSIELLSMSSSSHVESTRALVPSDIVVILSQKISLANRGKDIVCIIHSNGGVAYTSNSSISCQNTSSYLHKYPNCCCCTHCANFEVAISMGWRRSIRFYCKSI